MCAFQAEKIQSHLEARQDKLLFLHTSRYILSGGTLTIFGYGAIILLTSIFKMNPYWANFIIYVAFLMVSYWLNARVVFHDTPDIMSFLRFLFSFFLAYTTNLIVLSITLNKMHIELWVSQLIATAAYSCVHFSLSRAYVFKWESEHSLDRKTQQDHH